MTGRKLLPVLLLVLTPQSVPAQLVTDTLFSWQGYGHTSTCRIRVFESAPKASRARTIVIDELAANRGASTLDDVRHLAELVGRALSQNPEEAFWIFRWGAFSFPGADDNGKEVYLRATFRSSDYGTLGPPYWRLIDRAAVIEYTDRAFHR